MSKYVERDHFDIGEQASLSKVISMHDIETFAGLVGDDNPLHVDAEYAATTRFGGRIAHGILVSGLISAVLGTKLPGPGAVYSSQHLAFRAPVMPEDTITAKVEVVEWDSQKGYLTLATEVTNQDGVQVIRGEARMVMSAFLKGS